MTVDRNIISVEFDLPLPNEYLVDHSYSEGKSRRYTYHGPDRIWLQIDENNTEKYGPLEASDIADGRPIPEDVVEWFEVDCNEYPLICQLRAGVINELQEEYDEQRTWHPQSPEIEGYDRYGYGTPLMPSDLFDRWHCTIVDGVPTILPYTVPQKLLGGKEEPLTWDDIRKHRNKILKTSDTEIAEDMPEDLKQKWLAYRQILRDLPSTLEAAGVPPSIAYYMFPALPDYQEPE